MLCEVQPFVDVPKYNIKYKNLKLHLVLLGICLAALKLKHNICYKLRVHTKKNHLKIQHVHFVRQNPGSDMMFFWKFLSTTQKVILKSAKRT